ncbi:V4R domain-containing protein [Ureibacillus sp. GCM10028918]|uniref:V4R domain-containing protein n=1 Tax=Ureibacillus sp. GCM10028918 TaxID=3273429 RepID=UPI00361C546F
MVNSETTKHLKDKKISTTSATFGLLRKGLISHLGIKRAKAFLLRYGWNLGVENANEVLQSSVNLEEMISKGESLRLPTGELLQMVSKRTLQTNADGEVVYIHATGKWIDSFEAKEHLKNYGLSNSPVCHILAGLASGFTTMITKRKVFLKEIKCRAMGHDECCYDMRLEEEWQDDSEMLEEISLYKESSFIDELNLVYAKLMDQKNYIEKVSTFHETLTASKLSEGDSIEELIRMISHSLEIPVTIEDLNFQTRFFAGIQPDTYDILNEDFSNYISRIKNEKLQSSTYTNTFIIRGELHNRLVTPIVVQNQSIGYMTFIYTDQTIDLQKDLMLVQQGAISVANYLLTEKASMKEVDNLRGYFLEQLLLKQYFSVSHIINRGHSMGFDLKEPFYIATLQFSSDQRDANNSDFRARVIQSITRYLILQNYQILITQFENQIVMLLPKVKELKLKLENILDFLNHQFQEVIFRIGLSNESDSIENNSGSLEESQIVLRTNNQDPIVFFENAGMIGSLINSNNMSIIRRKAQKELQPILQLKEVKRNELLKTMYIFLMNGGNLQQSISELSLSLSGLLYRISKIEKLLNKELRNPKNAYELLIMLDALKVLGDIDVS